MVVKDIVVDALIFDFDGVIVDSEPAHLMAFQRVLASAGLELTRKEYYEEYLGCDDHDCLLELSRSKGSPLSEERISELVAAKTTMIQEIFADSVKPLPGALELIRASAEAGMPLAICSGALEKEIELACRALGVLEMFSAIVAADHVDRSKPDPEAYGLAAERLSGAFGRTIRPEKCVAVEDSPAGIASAKANHMKVLAVTTSYKAPSLQDADEIVPSLADVTIASLADMV